MVTGLKIKDTGRPEVGQAVSLPYVTYGDDDWVPLTGFTLRGEFNTTNTNFDGYAEDIYGLGTALSFQNNEVTAVLPPRFTIEGYVDATDTTKINKIILMGRTQGVKQLQGGLGLIAALPEAPLSSPQYIHVIIQNITFSEVMADTDAFIKFTIQVKQVR